MGKLRHIINVFLFVFTVSFVIGQSEDELKESATKLFEKEQYVEATSYYLRLLSLNPKNADYNFRYGTCLLFNSYQKVEAIRYLSYAIAEPGIDPRAFYFYGRALHLNYQFEDAIKFYRKFIELRDKKDKRYNVEREIQMCENGKKLLVTFTDIIVSEKQEIEEDKFFRLYKNMETIGGDILVSAEFQSKIDKKNGHVPIVHFPPQAKAIYYSSYGDSEDNGLDIYIRRRLPDGSWGDPQILPGQVNSPEDEDFPYMHPSGDFLYFSSKGHNSMGGYDVFLSRYNPDINAFGKPENVDFAISSPDDDFFYVVDSLFRSAYFASARQSQNGKLHVYNVRVARVPIREVIVMGDFISEINPNNETMRITVTSNSNGAEVGKIVSNQKGKYSFVFPKGGKYNYEITVDGNENNTYKYLVELPFLDEFRPLKQKAIHKMVDGEEIVTIINLFDESVEGAEAIIAEVIRKKSSLEVNVNDFDLKELERIEARNKALAEIGFNNMSLPEVSGQLNTLVESEKKRSEIVERIESNLDLAIIANSTELAKLDAEMKEILAKANQTEDPIEKHSLLMEAKRIESELNQLTTEVDLIEVMKNELIQKMGAPSTSGVGKIEVIENQFNVLVSSGKDDDALALLIKNKGVIQKAKNESPEKYVSDLVEKSVKLNEDIKALKKQQVEFELNESTLSSQINQLKNQLIDAKKKEAEQIKSQIKDKENELVMVKEVLADTKKRIIEKNTELNALNNSIETLQKAMHNTDLAAYNKSEVEEVLKKAKQVESDVNAAHLDSQINEIERENPELNPEYVPIDSGENSLATIQNDYNEKMEEIQSNPNLSEEEKLNLLQKANNESVANVNRRINAIERELSVTPDNEALIAEQNSLNEYKNELEAENEQLNNDLLAYNNSNVNQSNVLEYVKSDLEKRIAEIKSDNSISEEEKINLQKQANNESISQLEERIEAVKSELRSNPNNSSFKNELSALNQYKASIESENQTLDNELLVLNSTSDVNDLVAIQNGLNEKLSEIQSDNSKSAEEKIIAQQQANNVAISQIDKRLSQIEKTLNNEPNNASLKNEKTALNEYKGELEAENQRLGTELLALKNSTANQQNQLSTIQSDLKEKVNEIQSNNSLSEVEKIKQLQQANNETITKIEKRFQEIERQLSNDPNNASLKSEKTALENYKSELQSENLSLNSDLIALNNGTTPESNQLASIQSDLKVRVNEIQSNNSLSEVEKIKQLQQANNETIAKIEKRIEQIDNQLSNDPNNASLKSEKAALENYKSELQSDNLSLNEDLIALNNDTTPEPNQLTSIQSDLKERVNEIQSNNSLSEVEKIKQLQQANNETIVKIEKIIEQIDNQLSNDPSNSSLKSEKAVLENYKSELQSDNLSLNADLIALNNGTTPVSNQLASIQSDLKEKVNQIQSNSSLSEADKIKQLQQANNETIAKVNQRINSIENQLSSSSENSVLLEEQLALVEYKTSLERENAELAENLLALNNGNSSETSQLATIQSDLNEKVNEIQSKNSLSEVEKIKQIQQANNESIAKVNQSINVIENQLTTDPDNTALLEEQLALVQYKNSLDQENDELAEQLLALNSANSYNNVATVTREEILNSVQSDYQEKVNEIQSDNSLSKLEKLNQLQTLDQKLIASLQKENTSNNKALNKQPSDENLQAKKEILESLIAQKQNEVEERAQVINAKSNVSSVVDIESVKTELLASVNQEYDDKKAEIENSNSTEFEKVEALLELEIEQLNQLKSKQTEIERSLKRNSSDEHLLAQQQAISSLVKDQEQVIEKLKSEAIRSIPADMVAEKVNQADPNFVNDIETIKSENTSTQQQAIIEREKELQEKLIAKIEEKEKALNRSYSVSVDLEKMTFEIALEESNERVENAGNNNVQNDEKDAFIAEIRSTNSTEIENSMQANPSTKFELEKADQILAQYENELKERIATVESELRISPTEELTAQKEWLEDELEEVQKKRRQFSISIGELETEVIVNNQTNAQLNDLAQEEQSILEKLNDPNNSNAEKKELQAQLNEVANEKVTLENKATELAINENKKENEQLTTNLNQLETNSNVVDKAKEFNTEENQAIEELTVQASKAKTEEEKKFLLTEAEERQNLLNSTLKEIVNNEKQLELEKEEDIKISSREELENQKRKFTIQIGELTTEIIATEKQIDKAKKKDIPALETRKQQLINQRSLLEMQLRTIEERIVQEDQLISVAAENSLNENITFNEERKLAGTEEYKEYYELASKTLDTERELSLLEQELMKEQKKVRSLLETQLANENEAEIQLSVSKIKSIQEKIDRLKIEHVQQKYAAEQKLSSNPEDAIRMQNLVLRDVQPIEASSVAASLIAMPSNGFEIKTNAPSTYSAENPIPIDVDRPSGLYYRVQIGAFAKPIPQDLFKEFTPVSGEKIEGSNIVRYMAGFFNSSTVVVDARAKIRALGYSDAFIVAYCDGKRIGFGEARRLEAQGLCVPKGENELVMEVVTKTAEKLGLPTNKEVQEVPELSYNQSPGAVKADPIELKKGLFFTTQVGVYNRPIAAESVFGMEELITLRLPNGQIRYSSGTFNSIEEAKPRRTEALNKGIKGAFITAYYKGERISLTEAKRLLEENGNTILQSEIEKTEKVEEVIIPKNTIRTDSVNVEKTTKVIAAPKESIQIVSQNQYTTFPTEVLNKFNMEGNFYYDTKDKRIKSIVYKTIGDLPNLINLRNDIDTLYLEVDETNAIDEQVIIVKTNTTVVPGDFMDWLMRQPFQREFIQLDDKVEIRLKGIEPNQIEKVQEDIRTFVLEMEVRNVSEVEFESLK